MKKDSILILIIGLLFGFILGYMTQEWVARERGVASPSAGPRAPQGASAPVAQRPPQGPSMEEINALKTRVEQNPEDSEAVLRLANLNFDINRWERARSLYEQFLRLNPDNPDVITDLGVCYRQMGEGNRALELFQKAQSLDANHLQSRYNQVIVHGIDRKDYAEAFRVLEDLEGIDPGNSDVARLRVELERRQSEE